MRASAAATAVISATLGHLFVAAERTWADDCQAAFEKWALMSSAQVRPAQDGGGRGACVASESARRSLLDALARARGLCGDSTDASLQQTRTLISINQGFITSLGVCASESADAGAGWVAKAAPVPEKPPKIAAPLPPAAPAAKTGGPRPSVIAPPKPAAAAPLAVSPKAQGATPKPPCLEIAAAQGDIYPLINRRCRGHTVIAVIETRAASGATACKAYTVGTGVNVRGASTPRVNFECVANQDSCNKDRLGDMFPECDW